MRGEAGAGGEERESHTLAGMYICSLRGDWWEITQVKKDALPLKAGKESARFLLRWNRRGG